MRVIWHLEQINIGLGRFSLFCMLGLIREVLRLTLSLCLMQELSSEIFLVCITQEVSLEDYKCPFCPLKSYLLIKIQGFILWDKTRTEVIYSWIHVNELCIIIRFLTRKLDNRCSECLLDRERMAVSTWRKVRLAKNGEGMRHKNKNKKVYFLKYI